MFCSNLNIYRVPWIDVYRDTFSYKISNIQQLKKNAYRKIYKKGKFSKIWFFFKWISKCIDCSTYIKWVIFSSNYQLISGPCVLLDLLYTFCTSTKQENSLAHRNNMLNNENQIFGNIFSLIYYTKITFC